LLEQLTDTDTWLPPEAREIIEGTIVTLKRASRGAGIIGFALLLYTASTVFGVLNQAVDAIWNEDTNRANAVPLRQTVMTYVVNRAIAFFLVLSTSLLLLASLLSQIWVESVVRFVYNSPWQLPWLDIEQIPLADGLNFGLSIATIALSTLFLLKMLPSVSITWRDVWPGALLTAALFFLLQWLVTNSIFTLGSRYASYGVVGSVMILLLWIYFTGQIFFLGCEFSYVYSYLFGSRRHTLGRNTDAAK
jgi:membrane protein